MRGLEREPVGNLRKKLKKKQRSAHQFGPGMFSTFYGIFSFHTFLS